MRHFIDLSTEELEELYNHLHAESSMPWLKEKLARHISCYNLEFSYGKDQDDKNENPNNGFDRPAYAID
jgi:hypothetical protein